MGGDLIARPAGAWRTRRNDVAAAATAVTELALPSRLRSARKLVRVREFHRKTEVPKV